MINNTDYKPRHLNNYNKYPLCIITKDIHIVKLMVKRHNVKPLVYNGVYYLYLKG